MPRRPGQLRRADGGPRGRVLLRALQREAVAAARREFLPAEARSRAEPALDAGWRELRAPRRLRRRDDVEGVRPVRGLPLLPALADLIPVRRATVRGRE